MMSSLTKCALIASVTITFAAGCSKNPTQAEAESAVRIYFTARDANDFLDGFGTHADDLMQVKCEKSFAHVGDPGWTGEFEAVTITRIGVPEQHRVYSFFHDYDTIILWPVDVDVTVECIHHEEEVSPRRRLKFGEKFYIERNDDSKYEWTVRH